MNESKLSIPIYLNQRVVFDMLAIIQDGFSNLKTVKSTIKNEDEKSKQADIDVGAGNIFAFLNIGMKAGLTSKGHKADEEEITQEKVYTPASLFSKFRETLYEHSFIKSVTTEEEFHKLKPGDFIEFSGVLSKNPMVGFMEALIQVFETAMVFDNKKRTKNDPNNQITDQMKKFLSKLTNAGYLDLITQIDNVEKISAVIPVQMEFFENNSPASILDGNYKVLGKIARIINDEGEISLLRGTAMSYMPESTMSEMMGGFIEATKEFNFKDEFVTKINGPALLLIPIAIFS